MTESVFCMIQLIHLQGIITHDCPWRKEKKSVELEWRQTLLKHCVYTHQLSTYCDAMNSEITLHYWPNIVLDSAVISLSKQMQLRLG